MLLKFFLQNYTFGAVGDGGRTYRRDKLYMKIVASDEIYNFVVQSFFPFEVIFMVK
jgi:hypothetical protein